MVRALLAGTKTQTRRVVKAAPPPLTYTVMQYHHPDPRPHFYAWADYDPPTDTCYPTDWCQPCPYGAPGDRLWVRETWAYGIHALNSRNAEREGPWVYGADPAAEQGRLCDRWRPSIHMRREACRLVLEITDVRVERLQEISESDSRAEGVEWLDHPPACAANEPARGWRGYENHEPLYRDTARDSFASLWRSINGARSWEANPWVWVVEFKRAES